MPKGIANDPSKDGRRNNKGARHPANRKALQKHYNETLPEMGRRTIKKAAKVAAEKNRQRREALEAKTAEEVAEEFDREQDNLARRELAQRELCRKHLLAYVLFCGKDWIQQNIMLAHLSFRQGSFLMIPLITLTLIHYLYQ